MITIDTVRLSAMAGGTFGGFWQLISSGVIPLSTWFVLAYSLLWNTKANPHKDFVARLKVTAAGLLLVVATVADLISWAAS